MGTADGNTPAKTHKRQQPPAVDSASRPLAEANEAELIARYQSGSPAERKAAFYEIYQRCREDLMAHARATGLPEEDAQDVFGQAWVVAARRLATFEWRGVSLIFWLRKIVDRLAERKAADLARTQPFSHDDTQAAAERVPDPHPAAARDLALDVVDPNDEAVRRIVLKVRGCLKPKERLLVDLLYVKGLNATQAAEALGKTPEAVRKAHERLRKKMMKCAEQRGLELPPNWRLVRDKP